MDIEIKGVGQQSAASVSQLTDHSISTRGRRVAVLRIVNISARAGARIEMVSEELLH